jgi:hypothetical protein
MDLDDLLARYGYLVLLLGSFADGTPVMLFGGFAAHRGWLVLVPYAILAGGARFFALRLLGDKVLARRPQWAKEAAKVRPYKLLIVDELGYVPLSPSAAELPRRVRRASGSTASLPTEPHRPARSRGADPASAALHSSRSTAERTGSAPHGSQPCYSRA